MPSAAVRIVIVQAKLSSVVFQTASAAIAVKEWPLNSVEPQPAIGQVSITFSAVIERAGASYPNSEMRACETAAAEMVLDHLQGFGRLLKENEVLRAKIAALEATR
jgi:hypothetical protein